VLFQRFVHVEFRLVIFNVLVCRHWQNYGAMEDIMVGAICMVPCPLRITSYSFFFIILGFEKIRNNQFDFLNSFRRLNLRFLAKGSCIVPIVTALDFPFLSSLWRKGTVMSSKTMQKQFFFERKCYWKSILGKRFRSYWWRWAACVICTIFCEFPLNWSRPPTFSSTSQPLLPTEQFAWRKVPEKTWNMWLITFRILYDLGQSNILPLFLHSRSHNISANFLL